MLNMYYNTSFCLPCLECPVVSQIWDGMNALDVEVVLLSVDTESKCPISVRCRRPDDYVPAPCDRSCPFEGGLFKFQVLISSMGAE